MLCPSCASPLPDGSVFCTNCGADAREPPSAAPAPLDDAGVAKLTRLLREETAGDYEIDRELARGGMGVVYVATEIGLRRRVAIKVLPPALTFGQGAIERFRREARTAAALAHPNIIPIYRVSAGGELLWYSMKLLEGKSLDTILAERKRLEFEETVALLDQVADALDYAHQHGVIHRDIKPGNIILDERGRVTVTDFGIAKEIQEASVSASGHMLGTPYYMSPEQYRGADISGAADQYSLGVLAFQCLGGRVPFDAATAYELLNKHVVEPPPPRHGKRPRPSSSSGSPPAGRASTSTAICEGSDRCTARSSPPARTPCGSSAQDSARLTPPSRSGPAPTSSRSRCAGRARENLRLVDDPLTRRRPAGAGPNRSTSPGGWDRALPAGGLRRRGPAAGQGARSQSP